MFGELGAEGELSAGTAELKLAGPVRKFAAVAGILGDKFEFAGRAVSLVARK